MLVKPLPGTYRDHLIEKLTTERDKADNLRGPFSGPAYQRLLAYLRWASQAARMLGSVVSPPDVARLVLTRRYDALLSGAASGLAGTSQEGVVNDLVNLELDDRVSDFNKALASLKEIANRWDDAGVLVVADSSVYIQHDAKLLDWDFQKLCKVREEPILLLFPMVVIDELDGLKQTKDPHRRWRAAYTLAVLEKHHSLGASPATIKDEDYTPLDSGGIPRGHVSAEIVYDPPGHVRLPINDDEIIDRAVTVQLLAGRPVHMLTYDTGQAMRARNADLAVTKLRPEAEGEPEPTGARRP
ncbi:PIN domain-containing protein [Streptomyces sp. NPDC048281]|uniref:PIN domain-containing protein n=1 Tax=Streptomyces sp. NPDC048281 TaxID=3154715 RepID=UPI00341A6244